MVLKKQISPKLVSLIFGILVICFTIVFYVSAWQDPLENPPFGNAFAPLNVSGNVQTKAGGLILNTAENPAERGLSVYQGWVGIGTLNPDPVGQAGTSLEIKDGALRFTGAASIPTRGIGHHRSGYLYVIGGRTGLKLTDDKLNGITILNGGNIGIGTDLPRTKLEIKGRSGVDGIMYPDETIQVSANFSLQCERVATGWINPIDNEKKYAVSCPENYYGVNCVAHYFDRNPTLENPNLDPQHGHWTQYHGYFLGKWNQDRTECSNIFGDRGITEGEVAVECCRVVQ